MRTNVRPSVKTARKYRPKKSGWSTTGAYRNHRRSGRGSRRASPSRTPLTLNENLERLRTRCQLPDVTFRHRLDPPELHPGMTDRLLVSAVLILKPS